MYNMPEVNWICQQWRINRFKEEALDWVEAIWRVWFLHLAQEPAPYQRVPAEITDVTETRESISIHPGRLPPYASHS